MPLISIPTVHNRKTANKFLMQAKESPGLYVKQIFSFFLKTCCKCILISTTGLRAAGRKLTTSRQIRTGKRTAQHNSKEKIKESPTMECKQLHWTEACLHLLRFHLLISAKAKHGWVKIAQRCAVSLLEEKRAQSVIFFIPLRWPRCS